MSFQIKALDYGQFAGLFALSDGELAQRRAVRQTATENPGFPVPGEPGGCRSRR